MEILRHSEQVVAHAAACRWPAGYGNAYVFVDNSAVYETTAAIILPTDILIKFGCPGTALGAYRAQTEGREVTPGDISAGCRAVALFCNEILEKRRETMVSYVDKLHTNPELLANLLQPPAYPRHADTPSSQETEEGV